MTTKAAQRDQPAVADAGVELAAALTELESSSIADFRLLRGPVAEVHRLAEERGDEPAARRAQLLLADVLLREGRIGAGGRIAHEVRVWAEKHDCGYVLARAHRVLSVFYRLVGDLSDALAHAVQCLAHLAADVPPAIRARHVLTLAVALDDSGSMAEGELRYHTSARWPIGMP